MYYTHIYTYVHLLYMYIHPYIHLTRLSKHTLLRYVETVNTAISLKRAVDEEAAAQAGVGARIKVREHIKMYPLYTL